MQRRATVDALTLSAQLLACNDRAGLAVILGVVNSSTNRSQKKTCHLSAQNLVSNTVSTPFLAGPGAGWSPYWGCGELKVS